MPKSNGDFYLNLSIFLSFSRSLVCKAFLFHLIKHLMRCFFCVLVFVSKAGSGPDGHSVCVSLVFGEISSGKTGTVSLQKSISFTTLLPFLLEY